MTREEAYEKLQDYLDDNLQPEDKENVEIWLDKDPEMLESLEDSKQIDLLLKDQTWIAPSDNFTHNVFEKAGISEPRTEAAIERYMEHASAWAPVCTLALVAVFYGNTILKQLLNLWNNLGTWLESEVGFSFIKTDPLLSLGVFFLLICTVSFSIFFVRRGRVSA